MAGFCDDGKETAHCVVTEFLDQLNNHQLFKETTPQRN
jgi:hypothetical protein